MRGGSSSPVATCSRGPPPTEAFSATPVFTAVSSCRSDCRGAGRGCSTWPTARCATSRPRRSRPPAGAPSTHARAAQIEKARALGEMAGGLARELNDVFALILGKSRLLLARTHDEPLREGLELLEEAAWRGADVVHGLIALAMPTSGEAAGPVDMTALVQDVIALTCPRWKDEAEGRGARIDLVTDLQGAPPVRGSETALREALVNLVLNAVDAMPLGGRLSLATRPREGGVELALEDTGEGIAE